MRHRRSVFDPWVWKTQEMAGNGNLLQYSCLENAMDRGAWKATVHGVAKGWTQLSDWVHTGTDIMQQNTFECGLILLVASPLLNILIFLWLWVSVQFGLLQRLGNIHFEQGSPHLPLHPQGFGPLHLSLFLVPGILWLSTIIPTLHLWSPEIGLTEGSYMNFRVHLGLSLF